MMKSLSLAALLLLVVCVGVSGNGGTEMYGEITTGVEAGRMTFGRRFRFNRHDVSAALPARSAGSNK